MNDLIILASVHTKIGSPSQLTPARGWVHPGLVTNLSGLPQANRKSLTLTFRANVEPPVKLKRTSLGCGRQLERTLRGTGTTCKFLTERHQPACRCEACNDVVELITTPTWQQNARNLKRGEKLSLRLKLISL